MLSFKITKKATTTSSTIEKARLPQSSKRAFNDDNDKEDDEPDFIDRLDGNDIVSKKQKTKTVKEALVIPLITKNEWRIDDKILEKRGGHLATNSDRKEVGDSLLPNNNPGGAEVTNGLGSNGDGDSNSLKQLAIKELMEEASTAKSSDKTSNNVIPILFQNRVPDGYEEDDNMDVSLRPEQSTLDDYERIPIDEFGLAMLRGMGWKETEGIGLKNKKVVDMAEPKLRPKGMGLGAEAAHLNKDITPKNSSNSKEEKEDLSIKIGGHAVITRGSKKGYYGQIESFDEDNNRIIMRLAISGKMEAVSKFYINMVPSGEYKKNSKVVNIEKYEEYFTAKEKEKINGSKERREPQENNNDNSNSNSSGKSDHEQQHQRHHHKDRQKRADKDYEHERRKHDKHDNRHNRHEERRDRDKSRDDRDRSDSSYKNSSRHDSKRDRDESRHEHRDRRRHGGSSRHSS